MQCIMTSVKVFCKGNKGNLIAKIVSCNLLVFAFLSTVVVEPDSMTIFLAMMSS